MKNSKEYTLTLIRDELYKMTSWAFMELWNSIHADDVNADYIHPMSEFSITVTDCELTPMDVVILTQNNHIDFDDEYFILDIHNLVITTFNHQSELEEKIIAPFVKHLYFLDSDMYNDFPKGTEGLITVLKVNKGKTIKDVAETIFGKDAPLFNLCPDGLVEEKIECDRFCPNCNKCLEEFWNRPYEEEK